MKSHNNTNLPDVVSSFVNEGHMRREVYQCSLKAQSGWNWIVSGAVCLESRVKACRTSWGALNKMQKSTWPHIP